MIEDIKQVDPIVSQTPQDNEPMVKKEVNRGKVLTIVLLVLVFLFIGLFAYLFFTDRLIIGKDDSSSNDTSLVGEETEDTETTDTTEQDLPADTDEDPIVDEKEELNTYTNNEVGVSFQYSDAWKVTKNSTTKDDVGYNLQLEITNISNPKWSFEYYYPSGSGPAVCIYSDSTVDKSDVLEYIELASYATISDSEGNFRRTLDADKTGYTICREEASGNNYVTWVNPGYANYNVDSNDSENQTMLADLDDILGSLKDLK